MTYYPAYKGYAVRRKREYKTVLETSAGRERAAKKIAESMISWNQRPTKRLVFDYLDRGGWVITSDEVFYDIYERVKELLGK